MISDLFEIYNKVKKINFHLGPLSIDLRTRQKRNRMVLILWILGGPGVIFGSLFGFDNIQSVIGLIFVLLGVFVNSPDFGHGWLERGAWIF